MAVARHEGMRLITKLLVLGSAIAGATYLRKHRAAGPIGEPQPSPDEELGMIPDADIIEEIVIVGISEVDPEEMTLFGEGIDLEANQAAHENVRDPRDRLPRSR